jgi:hypothetical protein
MTPTSFTFKVSVPNDPDLAAIIGDMAKHAAEYGNVEAGAAAAFAARALAMATKAMKTGGTTATTAVFSAKDGTLTVTIGSESASQPLS